jgi:hypothetical protein
MFLGIAGHSKEHIQPFGRFAITAEYKLTKLPQIILAELGCHFLIGWLTFKPERPLVDGRHSVPALANAERAGARALIGKVHIEIIVYLIQYGHSLIHKNTPSI